MSNTSKLRKQQQCFNVLKIPPTADGVKIRRAYLKLVKKYHPDSGTKNSNKDNFCELQDAFKTLNKQLIRRGSTRYKVYEKNPWLSLQHGGANSTKGSGVPSKEAFGYFTKRGLVINKYNFESKEQFNKINDDRMTDVKLKVYSQNEREIRSPPSYKGNYSKSKSIEVLVGNEFSPIWISLHKSITNDIDIFSSEMAQKRAELGPIPLTPYDQQIWESLVAKYEKRTNGLKTKIAIYNLFLPITNKPLLEFNYSNICSEILQYGNFKGRFTLGVKNTGQNKVKKDRVIEKLESFVEFLIKRYVKIKEFYKRGR